MGVEGYRRRGGKGPHGLGEVSTNALGDREGFNHHRGGHGTGSEFASFR